MCDSSLNYLPYRKARMSFSLEKCVLFVVIKWSTSKSISLSIHAFRSWFFGFIVDIFEENSALRTFPLAFHTNYLPLNCLYPHYVIEQWSNRIIHSYVFCFSVFQSKKIIYIFIVNTRFKFSFIFSFFNIHAFRSLSAFC